MSMTKALRPLAALVGVFVATTALVVLLAMIDSRNKEIERSRQAYTAQSSAVSSLRDSLADTQEALQQTEDELSDTQIALRLKINDVSRLSAENEDLRGADYELKRRQDIQTSYDELLLQKRELVDEIEALENEVRVLKGGLATLDPLPEISGELNLACTGSMEPTISCGDSVLMLRNWRSNPLIMGYIPVGSIVVFRVPPSCPSLDAGSSVVHRVIKNVYDGTIDGQTFYTKGDANQHPDNCRLVPSDIEGYVVAIHKAANPGEGSLN